MQAEIITIGDEILIGQVIDTNSAFIAKALNDIGVSVFQISSVQDERTHILTALKEARERADIILITGGLGPTKDDITKHTLVEFFDDELVQHQETLQHVEHLFEKYISTPISDLNRRQALVPSKAKVLKNKYGTAPGMWLEENGKVYVSLPGVPYEMRALVNDEVLPLIQQKFHRPYILHRTVLTYGLGESAIAEKIEAWEDALPRHIKLAYLPNLGRVRLRLTARGEDKEALEAEVEERIKELYPMIGDIIYGMEEDGHIEELVGKLLASKKRTLSIAESCTGGKIASMISSVPGASAYFRGGAVTYATESKIKVLGIDPDIIREHGVVSAEVAEQMAVRSRELFGSDYALSTTGNAGPTKGDEGAGIGQVYIGMATPEGSHALEYQFGNHREKVINKAANKALEMLQKEILKK
ncbi:competence/damage-inducible protein A [Robertkochia aurantiaca]|uniref:competence/damage-inducible protein A n=1 Tax=Robertkochia aurantiaca TaxID=2873700 RepID=UPI001CCEF689|nr:competence/damage-inducible protein A [Robertkochia sp. 3YJGBD-33]